MLPLRSNLIRKFSGLRNLKSSKAYNRRKQIAKLYNKGPGRRYTQSNKICKSDGGKCLSNEWTEIIFPMYKSVNKIRKYGNSKPKNQKYITLRGEAKEKDKKSKYQKKVFIVMFAVTS